MSFRFRTGKQADGKPGAKRAELFAAICRSRLQSVDFEFPLRLCAACVATECCCREPADGGTQTDLAHCCFAARASDHGPFRQLLRAHQTIGGWMCGEMELRQWIFKPEDCWRNVLHPGEA